MNATTTQPTTQPLEVKLSPSYGSLTHVLTLNCPFLNGQTKSLADAISWLFIY